MRSPDAPAPAPAAAGTARGADGARAARFLEEALGAFERAAGARGALIERIGVAGRTAELRFAGPAMRARLLPALAHLGAAAGTPSLVVCVFDSASTGVRMPPPAWAPQDFADRGEVRGLGDDDRRIAFNVGSGMLSAHDRAAGRALVWTRDAEAVPYYETASPMRPLLAWWLADAGLQVVHAAAVGDDGHGVLLTGRGHSGKTTTALLCVEAGLAYAGDNNLVLEPGTPVRGHALYASATVRPGTLERVPALRERLRNADRLDAEKGMLFVDGGATGRLLPSFVVDAVLLPRVAGGTATRTEPATAAACLAALGPSSLLSLPGARDEAFRRLASLSRAAPAHHLLLADDPGAIPGVVASFLRRGG
jgi:hypothetical protein